MWAALLVGLSVTAAPPPRDIYEDDPPPSKQRSGSRGPFGAPAPKPAAPDKSAAKKPAAPAPKPSDPLAERQREENALQRRLAVVLRLREIALATNDAELDRMADQLDERVWTAYVRRVAALPAGRVTFESDEKVLEKHLQPAAVSARPGSPPAPAGANKDRGSRAALEGRKR
jgi:hypothetical protein